VTSNKNNLLMQKQKI